MRACLYLDWTFPDVKIINLFCLRFYNYQLMFCKREILIIDSCAGLYMDVCESAGQENSYCVEFGAYDG